MKQAYYGLALYLLLMIPPVITGLESVMITHMLVQMPLLVLSGWLIARFFQIRFPSFFEKFNRNGVPGITMFIIITMYWMIPRTMDEALLFHSVEIFKFISLPFLAGVLLRDSWNKLGITGKGFVVFNYIPMFGLMGWLYVDSPIQLCNNYLESEQQTLGWGFLFITAVMILYMVQSVFTDQSDRA